MYKCTDGLQTDSSTGFLFGSEGSCWCRCEQDTQANTNTAAACEGLQVCSIRTLQMTSSLGLASSGSSQMFCTLPSCLLPLKAAARGIFPFDNWESHLARAICCTFSGCFGTALKGLGASFSYQLSCALQEGSITATYFCVVMRQKTVCVFLCVCVCAFFCVC